MSPPTDRVILGNHSEGSFDSGLFVSKPAQNVHEAGTANLLFDSSPSGYGVLQIIGSGRAIVANAFERGTGGEGSIRIVTGLKNPHEGDAPLVISWNKLLTDANTHPTFGGILHGGTETGPVEKISNFSSLETQFTDGTDEYPWQPGEIQGSINEVGLICYSHFTQPYGFYDDFNWTRHGANGYALPWPWNIHHTHYGWENGWLWPGRPERLQATRKGTLLVYSGGTSSAERDSFYRSLNAYSFGRDQSPPPGLPSFTYGEYGHSYGHDGTGDNGVDQSFVGNNYPILEVKIRRPKKSDGSNWTTTDLPGDSSDMRMYFRSSNGTVGPIETHAPPPDPGDPLRLQPRSYPWSPQAAFVSAGSWDTIMGTNGDWVTFQWDFENKQTIREINGVKTITTGGHIVNGADRWVSNTYVDGLRFDFSAAINNLTDPDGNPEYDLEIEHIKAVSRSGEEKTLDLVFKNGSLVRPQSVFWSVFREKGI